ncbi:hypothetical protein B0H13DRAFT_1858271 [Mycena leptocephala]|nr:hypothetical protein B0H13DRAFT_1858271 [Mycena leptocephala]
MTCFQPDYILHQSRAKSASNGSSADLISLLRLIPKATDPKRLLLIPLLFIHLDPSRIPTPSELDSILCDVGRHPELSRVSGAQVALRAVADMLDGVVPLPAYADLWPRLYRWTIFIHGYWDSIPDDYNKKATGLRRILAEYWAKVLLQVICTNLEFAYILPFVLDRDAIRDDTKFAEILDGIGGSESDLAYLLVQQINNTVASPITSATTLALDSVMQLLNARATPALRAGMLIHGGAKAVIDAIYFAEEARPRFPRAGEGVYLTAIFLSGSFESEAGAEWVSKALSAGLLKLIVTLGRARQTESDEMWLTYSLLQRSPPNRTPDPRGVSDGAFHYLYTAFAKCVIATFWSEFSQLMQERFRAVDFFLDRRSISLACENHQVCSKIDERRTFKRCAGCGLASYCSQECQSQDWAAAHSASCQTLGWTAPANTRERDYLRAILQTNFESFAIRMKVLTQQARFMYMNPGVDFVTVYDFSRNAAGVDLIYIPRNTVWCKVNHRSDYYASAPARLAQLARGAGDIRLHVAVLTLDAHMKSPERMFPMWSTPELHDSTKGTLGTWQTPEGPGYRHPTAVGRRDNGDELLCCNTISERRKE